MRLGQLARKLSVRPEEIVSFLAAQNMHIENGNNTRLEDSHVAAILHGLAPNNQQLQEEIHQLPDQQDVEPVIPNIVESLPAEAGVQTETPEVIKAPKIELPGLRVLGKIELPEKKKPLPLPETEPAQEEPREVRRYQPNRETRKTPSRDRKNPIAMAREREERERKEKQQQQREQEKKRRTEFYMKRLKPQAPTRAARIVQEETIEMPPLEERPKTLWGRFMRWLNT